MTGIACEMRDDFCKSREKRPADYGLENAIARKVRRESPANTIDYAAAKFGLTTGRARGVVNGTASLATINAAIKKGGWALAAELIAEVVGQSLEQYIEEQARRARHEEEYWAAKARADEARLVVLSDHRERVGGRLEPHRGQGSPDA